MFNPDDDYEGIKHFQNEENIDSKYENIRHFQDEEWDELQRIDEMAGIGHFSD